MKKDGRGGDNVIYDRMLQIGDTFDHYQILDHVARGGMSDIYRAFDLLNRREVAIKIPEASIIGDPAQFERFQRELEVLNALDHPSILKGLGSGYYNRVPYLVTEFLQGQPLRDLIDPSAPLRVEEAVALTRKIAAGMAYCHENGIVHRDLKPENIILSAEGRPVIMDFGLALTRKAHRVTYSNLTATLGTPDYMAPEQIEGERGDARTDIYALGTIFFEMLAGRLPFTGDNQLAVMAQHMNASAPRLDRLRSEVPPGLAAVAARCLQHEPARRFQTMHELIAALDHPEEMDLSILEAASGPNRLHMFFNSVAFKATAISLGIILVIILLAILLQGAR